MNTAFALTIGMFCDTYSGSLSSRNLETLGCGTLVLVDGPPMAPASLLLAQTATLEASLAPRNDVPLWIAHQLYRVREVDDEGFLDDEIPTSSL